MDLIELNQPFEEDQPERREADLLLLALDGFDGPIDLLLTLARDQKVDLTKISILQLADQYLDFINRARELKLEIAADYLVMAAWLAYLKSRLLLPVQESDEDGEDPAELAARLAFQLQRLEAMQKASKELLALPKLGEEVFVRGAPEKLRIERKSTFDVSLYELLKAYGTIQDKVVASTLRIMPTQLYSMDDAIDRLKEMFGRVPDWQTLEGFLPEGLKDPLVRRSALAATFAASLELTREGLYEIQQNGMFAPIYLRQASQPPEDIAPTLPAQDADDLDEDEFDDDEFDF